MRRNVSDDNSPMSIMLLISLQVDVYLAAFSMSL